MILLDLGNLTFRLLVSNGLHVQADLLMQGALVALQGQDIIAPALDDLLRRRLLTAHGVNGHGHPGQIEQRQHL